MRLWFVWLAAAAGACGGGGASDAGVDAPSRPLAIERVVDLGRFPEPSATVVGRDGGPGGALGGRLLWTFGDTFLGARNPVDNSNVLSATAGWSAPDAPLALVQPVDAGGFPAQFIPYTAAELAQKPGRAPRRLGPVARDDDRHRRRRGPGGCSSGSSAPPARGSIARGSAPRGSPSTPRWRRGSLATCFAPPEPLFLPQSVI
jgi:hypothetical protein